MLHSRRGFSTIEVTAVLIVILMVLISFRGYIQRGLTGRWKSVGDTFGQTKQYDPRGFGDMGASGGTLDCFFDRSTNKWVVEDCYRERKCDCTLLRGDGMGRTALREYENQCVKCKEFCWDGDARCN